MNEDLVLTYDQLTGEGRPAGWTVQRHADHATNGMVVVTAEPAITGMGLLPGQQINYRRDDDGGVIAYSKGWVEGAEPDEDDANAPAVESEATATTPEPQAPSTNPTPEPQASSTADAPTVQEPSTVAPDVERVEGDEGPFPRETGSGWFELSDGNKVRGEEAALEAQMALDEED